MRNFSLKDVLEFAAKAHAGQRRKYTGDDYIVHPIAVAELVKEHGGSHPQQSAALLHDVVEDTNHTLADMIDNASTIFRFDKAFTKQFKKEMAHLVEVMTKVHGSSLHIEATKVLKT